MTSCNSGPVPAAFEKLLASHIQSVTDFDDCYSDPLKSIKTIQQLSHQREPLSKSQWEFISCLVHRAYQSHRRHMAQGRYVKASLQAFAAWYHLAERYGLVAAQSDEYLPTNLRTNDAPDLIGTRTGLVWTHHAEYVAKNLNCAIRFGLQALDALDLHAALAPFLDDLIPVAIRSLVIQTKQPLHVVEHSYLSPFINPIYSERYSLNALCSGSSFTAGLSLTTHRSFHPLNSHFQYADLYQTLEEVTPENPETHCATYWLQGPTTTGLDGYCLRYLGHQMHFSVSEFEELRGLLRLARQQPDFMEAFALMAMLYGDI